jgi:hypothetical protein
MFEIKIFFFNETIVKVIYSTNINLFQFKKYFLNEINLKKEAKLSHKLNQDIS